MSMGSTYVIDHRDSLGKNHPHEYGEYIATRHGMSMYTESPP